MNPKWYRRIAVITALLVSSGVVVMATGATPATASSASNYTIAFVPKLVGIPYFAALEQGMMQASHRFGGKLIFEGPTTASVSGQDEDVQALIAQKVSAIGVSGDSPSSVCPLFSQAVRKHILVFWSDSFVTCSSLKLGISEVNNQQYANVMVDVLASQTHGSGEVAFESVGSTAATNNLWISYAKLRLKKYPGLHLVSIQYGGESITGAEQITSKLLAAYPNLKGIVGFGSTDLPGAAEAVIEAGKVGKIVLTGCSDPNTIRPYVEDGAIKTAEIWNPVNLGYLTYWGVLQMLEGHTFTAENVVPGLAGTHTYDASIHTLFLGAPLLITKANVNLNF
jgi:rhamnose transport system substrate-binding protein